MKQGSLMRSALVVAGCWLAAGVAWAEVPFPVPATGGLPQCEAELAECIINLTETEGLLQACEDALAQCQATEGQAFPATGQTSCWYYDDTNSQYVEDPECTNPLSAGQDGDIQAGSELSYTDTGLTIIDNNTKLEWMKQDNNNSSNNCDGMVYPRTLDVNCSFTWDEAVAFVATLNENNHAGHADWRMPNIKELQSILNYGRLNPAVSDAFHNECISHTIGGCTLETCSCTNNVVSYWSSTTYPYHRSEDPIGMWDINFSTTRASFDWKGAKHIVRAVRGGL